MTNQYTSQSDSGYNASPPPDDGTTGADNLAEWADVKTKLADPVRTNVNNINSQCLSAFALTVNTNDDDNYAMGGSLAFTESTLTIATGSVTATRSAHVIAAESGTADDLANITTGSVSDFCILHIRPDTGDTITVKDAATGAGEIHMANDADFVMSGDESLTLQRRGADWYEIARSTLTDGAWDFTSSQQTVTADTVLDVAHSLGAKPTKVQVSMICTTNDLNYVASTNDEIIVNNADSASVDRGFNIFFDATNVTIVQGQIINLLDASTLNTAAITVTSWRWVVRASLGT